MNMSDNNDDIWMKPPVNYTPWFKWLINKREESFDHSFKKALLNMKKIRRDEVIKDLPLDLYLVEYNKDDGQFKSNFQREKEGMKNRYFLDDDELRKLLDESNSGDNS